MAEYGGTPKLNKADTMKKTLIKNARVVNEGKIVETDLYINEQGQIAKIDNYLSQRDAETTVIDADGQFLLPGIIDDQVHFREPGFPQKGTIESESKAAVAGGITSYIEQPNTKPQAVTLTELEKKYQRAAQVSYANYGFNLGATNDNIEELRKADPRHIPGIKVFMGSSTGNMLVDVDEALDKIFSITHLPIITHCEDEDTIEANLARFKAEYGDDIPMRFHPEIRSREACLLSSQKAVNLARKHGTRLHVFHISTAEECELFSNKLPLPQKQITSEACVHHLWFHAEDYDTKGSYIKWNPSVKTRADRDAIFQAVLDDKIDVIATDHAPHSKSEKEQPYTAAPSGGPLVQHALPAMLEYVRDGKISIEKLVEKMCHNPAILFNIKQRGYIREGYQADLVLVDMSRPWQVNSGNLLYHCGWSPFDQFTFRSRVTHTFVNGALVYEKGKVLPVRNAQRLEYDR